MGFFTDLAEKHHNLKTRIHKFRAPIKSKLGLFAVGCFYFSVPLIGGYILMNLTGLVRDYNLGSEGKREKLIEAQKRWKKEEEEKIVYRKDTPLPPSFAKVPMPTKEL